METQQGICPKCQSDNLNYFNSETTDNGMYYPYTCNDCEFEGQEHYDLVFSGHYSDDGIGSFIEY